MRFLWKIEMIKYSNRPIARGVILASRKYKSELARTQKPCQVFDSDGHKISFQTPHKRDFRVFVPADALKQGQALTWLMWDTDTAKTFERVLKIKEVSTHHAVYEVESEKERVFQKRRFKKRPWNMAAEHSVDFEFENPFISDAVFQAQQYQKTAEQIQVNINLQAPDVLTFSGKQYHSKTNFCFIYAPKQKKKTGSVWQRVFPESIELEFFRHDFELYDLLTGRKVDFDLQTTRKMHFTETAKISPQWRQGI